MCFYRGCGGLNENGPIGSSSIGGGTVWEGLRGMALLEEVYYWRRALRFQKSILFPETHSLSPTCGSGCELSAVPAATLLLCHHEL